MPKSVNKKEDYVSQWINKKLPNHSEEEKQLARLQWEEFLDIASTIIINSQSRSEHFESND